MNFITDRTQSDVDLVKKLQTRGLKMTASEWQMWETATMRGAYNFTDLNRVETAVADIAENLGVSVVTKTDWGMWDIPTESDMVRYLDNINVIKSAVSFTRNAPTLPGSMSDLTYESANNIEKTLVALYKIIDSIPRCGEIYAGEV